MCNRPKPYAFGEISRAFSYTSNCRTPIGVGCHGAYESIIRQITETFFNMQLQQSQLLWLARAIHLALEMHRSNQGPQYEVQPVNANSYFRQ